MTIEEIRRTGIHPEPTHDREKMIAAQARGFREITMLILTGEADTDPGSFLQKVKVISHRAAEAGA